MFQSKYTVGMKKKATCHAHTVLENNGSHFQSLDKHKSINPQVCMMQIQEQSRH